MWSVIGGQGWGFSLSARQGRRLRQIIQESSEPVILHAEVDADMVKGSSELVNAVLPGTDLAHEEIWVLAHSSEPGARDNASGCCLSVEVARTLKTLIKNGKLPPLRRSIRFMNAVEVSGFLPYINARRNELDRVVAGLCLDSVGQDFTICGGEFVLFQSPEANASFIDGLMEYLAAAVSTEPIARFSNNNYATFPWHTERFWGNDAFVSDGYFDIPTPQITTWPDKFYHSSMDTPDQMSDNTLGKVGAIVGTQLYILATAGAKEAMWFANLASRDWKRRIIHTMTTEATKNNEASLYIRNLGRHLGYQGQDAITQVLRFASDDANLSKTVKAMADDMLKFATHEADVAVEVASAFSGQDILPIPEPSTEELGDSSSLVFKRLSWQHPSDSAFSESGRNKLSMLRDRCNIGHIWNWINGRRTIKEIYERAQFNTPIPYKVVQEYLELLSDEKFVSLV